MGGPGSGPRKGAGSGSKTTTISDKGKKITFSSKYKSREKLRHRKGPAEKRVNAAVAKLSRLRSKYLGNYHAGKG